MEARPCVPARFSVQHRRFPRGLTEIRCKTPAFLRCVASTESSSHTGNDKLESGNRMFVLGLGFVGQFFAQNLRKEGWIATGTCTSAMKKKQLEERGFDVCLFDANKLELSFLYTLKCYTHLLVSIPPLTAVGDPMLRHGELLRSVLVDGNLKWLGYLSSTSVYGDWGGAWVDEDYPPNPATDSAKLRLNAEEGWLNLGHHLGLSSQVFRLGGIYGPGRSAVDTILKQEPLSKAQRLRTSRQYTSRVHVEDVCQALKAVICMPLSRSIYNIVDDEPAPREVVFAYAKELIDKKWPGHVKSISNPEKVGPCVDKRSSGEKRVSNLRMKSELGVRLRHPSYRSGLQSIVNQIENPF